MAPSAQTRITAEQLADKQKEISVSEFFERNKQLLGFDSPTRALLTSVKEAVDNALDACEEARILPDLEVTLEQTEKDALFRMVVQDNGPGIVKRNIPSVFGRLLFGSRFHAIRQSRGQQGIGISAVVMYAQLTAGKPTRIRSKTGAEEPAHEMDLLLDVRAKKSVFEYLRETAIVNPHAQIVFTEPDGVVTTFPRATQRLPEVTEETKPHPLGIELGTLQAMAKVADEPRMAQFLTDRFSRVSGLVAKVVCDTALIEEDQRPADLSLAQGRRVIDAFQSVRLMAPSTESLSPIGELLIKKGLRKD